MDGVGGDWCQVGPPCTWLLGVAWLLGCLQAFSRCADGLSALFLLPCLRFSPVVFLLSTRDPWRRLCLTHMGLCCASLRSGVGGDAERADGGYATTLDDFVCGLGRRGQGELGPDWLSTSTWAAMQVTCGCFLRPRGCLGFSAAARPCDGTVLRLAPAGFCWDEAKFVYGTRSRGARGAQGKSTQRPSRRSGPARDAQKARDVGAVRRAVRCVTMWCIACLVQLHCGVASIVSSLLLGRGCGPSAPAHMPTRVTKKAIHSDSAYRIRRLDT